MRGRHLNETPCRSTYIFQLTTSWEADCGCPQRPIKQEHFNSRPRERPTYNTNQKQHTERISTHDLVRGRLSSSLSISTGDKISTHDLVRGRLEAPEKETAVHDISTHDLVRGRQHSAPRHSASRDISTHDLVRGRQNITVLGNISASISTHDLVRGRPSRWRAEFWRINISTHDLVRGRPWSSPSLLYLSHFNSRPRERPTVMPMPLSSFKKISTHDLVRGRHDFTCPGLQQHQISTHDLVRGRRWTYRETFRWTDSDFNSRPRERPTSGKLYQPWWKWISTHDLVRGRLGMVISIICSSGYFNSRPRERPTFCAFVIANADGYFNSRPRERPTPLRPLYYQWVFISTHDLVRGRLLIPTIQLFSTDISTHDLVRGRLTSNSRCSSPFPFQLTTSWEADSNFHSKTHFTQIVFKAYCTNYFYFSFIQVFSQSFFLENTLIFWCECSGIFLCTCLSHYRIKVSVTSNPGFAPMCSTLFL